MRVPIRHIAGVASLLLALQLSGCALFDSLHSFKDISERPPEGGANVAFDARPSTIQPSVRMSISKLEGAANAAVSQLLPFSASGRENIANWEVRDPIFHGCIFCGSLDADWSYSASLVRPISVTGAQNRLTIAVPAGMSGKVGLAGGIARLLSLSGKNVSAQAEVMLQTGLGVDKRYCAKPSGVNLNYRWLSGPEVEIIGQSCAFGLCVGPWNYNFASSVDPEIRKRLPVLVAGFQNAIPCDPLRAALSNVWRQYTFPLAIPYSGPMYVNVTPKSLYVPDLAIDATDLTFAARLDALVDVQAEPVPTATLPLPINEPVAISPGTFEFSVPVKTRYYTLAALAKQELLGFEIRQDTPLGGIKIRPTNVEVFPSRDRIAIGVKFILDYDRYILDTSGTVWLVAKVEAVGGGKVIRIDDVTVTRKFSNPIWDIASIALDGELRKILAKGFELDLAQPLQGIEQAAADAIAHAGDGKGFALQPSNVRIGVGRVVAGNQEFVAEGLFSARVDAAIDKVQ